MVMLQILHLSVWELREVFVHIPSEEGLSWECLVISSAVCFEFPPTSDPSEAGTKEA